MSVTLMFSKLNVTRDVYNTWFDVQSVNIACLLYLRSTHLGKAYKDGSLTTSKTVANRHPPRKQLMSNVTRPKNTLPFTKPDHLTTIVILANSSIRSCDFDTN